MPSGTTHGRRDGCEQLIQPRTPITIIGSDATPPGGTRSAARATTPAPTTLGSAGPERRAA